MTATKKEKAQEAIDQADPGGITILVAEGRYFPTTGTFGNSSEPQDATVRFGKSDGTGGESSLIGGYIGHNNDNLESTDPINSDGSAIRTALTSGDLIGPAGQTLDYRHIVIIDAGTGQPATETHALDP